MIAKGNLHAHGGRLATYMMKGKGDERTELIEACGFLSDDLREAFCAIQAIAETQTQCEKPFFHCYVRLPDNEALNKEKWLAVADRIETELGFDAQPRAVAFHIEPGGETHMHVAWSRIDEKEMRAIDPGLYKNKLTELCRDLEVEYGLRELQNKRPPEQQTKSPARPEFEEARRLGVDVDATRETIRACFDRSDNGPGFAVALAEHGLGLARGDERDFVVVDQEGGLHALGKRICGVTAKAVRERLGSEFRQSLPSVEHVRHQQLNRRLARTEVQNSTDQTPETFLVPPEVDGNSLGHQAVPVAGVGVSEPPTSLPTSDDPEQARALRAARSGGMVAQQWEANRLLRHLHALERRRLESQSSRGTIRAGGDAASDKADALPPPASDSVRALLKRGSGGMMADGEARHPAHNRQDQGASIPASELPVIDDKATRIARLQALASAMQSPSRNGGRGGRDCTKSGPVEFH